MRRLILAVLPLLCVLPSFTQDSSKVDVFGGFQYMHAGSFDGEGASANTFGWNGSGAFRLTRNIGVAADFSGNYRSENVINQAINNQAYPAQVHIYTYTFGPVVHLNPGGRVNPFVHTLFGAAHVRPTGCVIFSGSPDECGSGSTSGFAAIVGGGVDLRNGEHLSYRPVQLDWVRLPSEFGAANNNFRASTGIVFRF